MNRFGAVSLPVTATVSVRLPAAPTNTSGQAAEGLRSGFLGSVVQSARDSVDQGLADEAVATLTAAARVMNALKTNPQQQQAGGMPSAAAAAARAAARQQGIEAVEQAALPLLSSAAVGGLSGGVGALFLQRMAAAVEALAAAPEELTPASQDISLHLLTAVAKAGPAAVTEGTASTVLSALSSVVDAATGAAAGLPAPRGAMEAGRRRRSLLAAAPAGGVVVAAARPTTTPLVVQRAAPPAAANPVHAAAMAAALALADSLLASLVVPGEEPGYALSTENIQARFFSSLVSPSASPAAVRRVTIR